MSSNIRLSSDNKLRKIGFLLMKNFTMISLASAIEPLRMANQLSGQELYNWQTLTEDGGSIKASDGIEITPDASMADIGPLDIVIVAGGVNITRSYSQKQVSWLQAQGRKGIRMGGICTGTYVLAVAGLLDNHECSAHWECIASLQEEFPKVNTTNRLFSIDQKRLTSSGGTVPMDMMMNLIKHDHGYELSAAISEMFICDRIRTESDQQRIPLRHMLGSNQPKLMEIVSLMEANLEEPIGLDELAGYVGVSRRQLERLFQKYLNCSPSKYYLKLRLIRARQLLKQTSMSIIEVASACGFISTPHFSKCYRAHMGIPPREERVGAYPTLTANSIDMMHELNLLPGNQSTAHLALTEAKTEPSYATVRLN